MNERAALFSLSFHVFSLCILLRQPNDVTSVDSGISVFSSRSLQLESRFVRYRPRVGLSSPHLRDSPSRVGRHWRPGRGQQQTAETNRYDRHALWPQETLHAAATATASGDADAATVASTRKNGLRHQKRR